MKKGLFGKIFTYLVITALVCISFVPVIKNINFGLDLRGGFEILYKVETLDGSKLTDQSSEDEATAGRTRPENAECV